MGALPYVLHGILPESPAKLQAVLKLQRAVKQILVAESPCTCDFSQESPCECNDRGRILQLKQTVLEAVCEFEAVAPLTERALCFHGLTHVADSIHRWGRAANTWSFFGERYITRLVSRACMQNVFFCTVVLSCIHLSSLVLSCIHMYTCVCRCMGWLIRFVHNRDLAVENIATAYARQIVVLSAPVPGIPEFLRRLHTLKLQLPVKSILSLSEEVEEAKHALPGAYEVDIRETTRNVKLLRAAALPEGFQQAATRLFARLRFGRPDFEPGVKRMERGLTNMLIVDICTHMCVAMFTCTTYVYIVYT